MRFDGNFSNKRRCEVSQQLGETEQVTASNALTGPLRIIGFPDASYRNNDDSVLGRIAEAIFNGWNMTYGSLIDYESQKIKKTVLSTTVAELCSFMKCFRSCQFLRGLWMDISADVANIPMRSDAKNLVTSARTIHLP